MVCRDDIPLLFYIIYVNFHIRLDIVCIGFVRFVVSADDENELLAEDYTEYIIKR